MPTTILPFAATIVVSAIVQAMGAPLSVFPPTTISARADLAVLQAERPGAEISADVQQRGHRNEPRRTPPNDGVPQICKPC